MQQYFVPSAAPSRLYCEMNRIARRAVGIVQSSPRVSNNAREVESKHRSFKEMIQWRKEKDKKDRLVRNKVTFFKVNYIGEFFTFLEINGYP